MATAGDFSISDPRDDAAGVGAGCAKAAVIPGLWLGHQNGEHFVNHELASGSDHYLAGKTQQDFTR
jgi:hypothetical protein